MKTWIVLASAFLYSSFTWASSCQDNSDIKIKMISASFSAWKVIADEMKRCDNVYTELDNESRYKQPTALSASHSLYHIAGVTSETVVPLVNQGLIRPLDKYIEKYGENLRPNQFVTINDQVVAIAFMINTQHFVYRQDIFNKLGLSKPETYSDVLFAAQKIKESGMVNYPLGGTFKSGWNLGLEFTNLYFSYGGTIFKSQNQPNLNNDNGVKTLETLKKLTEYAGPEYLISDTTYIQKQLQQGEIAMANLWGSRVEALENSVESEVVGKMAYSASPRAVENGNPASTIWWDGFTIAANISEEEAERAFQVALHGISSQMANKNPNLGVWLIDGYQPTQYASGVVDNVKAGAPSFTGSSAMGIMQSSIGSTVANYLVGDMTAEETLKRIENKYRIAAKESGLL